ncbi:hypothetical protein RGU76_16350 [Bacillus pseudomycoides]|uniref:hypothetical protein n=1 Tax=Bacillus sp. DHT2 TaxID=2994532 RepID=UPI0022488E3B|nr:hypothetical protein [Bacillus sp. DHT2]MDR4916504.1 hypothetical protein [Bacillus pseudomycoides]
MKGGCIKWHALFLVGLEEHTGRVGNPCNTILHYTFMYCIYNNEQRDDNPRMFEVKLFDKKQIANEVLPFF